MSPEARPRAKTLESLGSYEVAGRLGGGGMAEVFLATQRMASGVERPVVIKAMLPHLAGDEDAVEMFLREARIASLLNHPNVVQIYDVPVIDGRPCIVMEFLRGRDLGVVMKRLSRRGERVHVDAAVAIIAQSAAGLHYAHKLRGASGQPLGLVHRDVSPQNLFLTRDGHVRVVDFGIAKLAGAVPLTQDGALKGKVGYMAPEQARGLAVDGRADEFALGVTFWEILAGRRLFSREDPLATLDALFHMEIPAPSSVRPQVPPELDAIVLRMCAREPDARYPSCDDAQRELRAFLRARHADPEERMIAQLLDRAVPPEEDGKLAGGGRVDLPTQIGEKTSALSASDLEPVEAAPSAVVRALPTPAAAILMPPPPSIAVESKISAFAAPPPPGTERVEKPREWRPYQAATAILCVCAIVFAFLYIFNDGRIPRLDPGTAPRAPTEPLRTGQERTGDPGADFRRAVAIEFASVPEGAVIEVDGALLPGYRLETMPSADVRNVRVLRDGRELWRWQGVFRETQTITVEIPEPVESKRRRRKVQSQ